MWRINRGRVLRWTGGEPLVHAEGGVGFKGGDEEEDGVGGEQESRDNNLCKLESYLVL